MTVIGVVGEDENHFRVVTALIDDALVNRIDWGARHPRELSRVARAASRRALVQVCARRYARSAPSDDRPRDLDEIDQRVLPVFGHRHDA